MVKEALIKVVERQNLSMEEMESVMREIMEGRVPPSLIASLITALRMKGESIDEITGAARAMRRKATKIPLVSRPVALENEDTGLELETILDTCGTGGDSTNTFNVSTTCAFVAAGAGVKVAKHGNRAVSSCCGSADVLAALGVNIELGPAEVGRCVDDIGIGFLYAPLLHEAMKYAIEPRREIGIRTIFNMLGPLTNPAGANAQVIGVYEETLTEKMAHAILNLGAKRAMVVHGMDGLDEITVTRESRVSEVKGGGVHTYFIDPRDYGFKLAGAGELKGGTARQNAEITMKVLGGEKGARRDIVLINSGAAIYVTGLAETLEDGVKMASESIDSGAALKKLKDLVDFSRKLSAT